MPDEKGKFGPFGGQFVPETLMPALEELIAAYEEARQDPTFIAEFEHLLGSYVGRPSPVTYARNLSEKLGGAQIYFKREDLNHTGAHKINNALGQALLVKRMGKQRVVAETGAGPFASPILMRSPLTPRRTAWTAIRSCLSCTRGYRMVLGCGELRYFAASMRP